MHNADGLRNLEPGFDICYGVNKPMFKKFVGIIGLDIGHNIHFLLEIFIICSS